MSANRPLALAGYLICVYLGVVPITETVLGLWPPSFGEVAWRYGAAGLFTQAFMTPLLGLCLAVALAVHLDHRRMVRFLALVSGAGALLTLIVLPLFVLDLVQMRGSVNEGAETAFDIASLSAVLKMSATILIGGAIAVGGWRATRESVGESGGRTRKPSTVVFRSGGKGRDGAPGQAEA
jgi:hypothetical protein